MKTEKDPKFYAYRFLLWCAGANPDILENRARFSDRFPCGRSEQIKQAWTGALVLIPPILAFVSMLYAASTLDISKAAILAVAFVWAIIIFILERYMVSSFRKSGSILKDLFSVQFIVRLVFSIGVGITISDPLVHGIFHESVAKKLSEMRQSEIDSVQNAYLLLTDEKQARKDQLKVDLKNKEQAIATNDAQLTAEIDGIVGKGTGLKGDGPSAKEKRAIRNRMLEERDTLLAQNARESVALDSSIAQLQRERDAKIMGLKFSDDYLARRHALAALAAEPRNRDIQVVHLFLIVFLVFVDLCCILYKAASTKGPYDDYLNYEEALSHGNRLVMDDADEKRQQAMKEYNTQHAYDHLDDVAVLKFDLRKAEQKFQELYLHENKYRETLEEEHRKFLAFVEEKKKQILLMEDKQLQLKESNLLQKIIDEFYSKAEKALELKSKTST